MGMQIVTLANIYAIEEIVVFKLFVVTKTIQKVTDASIIAIEGDRFEGKGKYENVEWFLKNQCIQECVKLIMNILITLY
jgi:hypothetical protein